MVLLEAIREFVMSIWHSPMGQVRPSLGPKISFWLNFTRIMWFFWELVLTLLIIPKVFSFCRNFGFWQYFWFYDGKLGLKMDQNCTFWVCSIWAKIQKFEGFFKHCVCLIGGYLWSNFQQDQTIFGGVRAQKILKRVHFMDAESIQNILNIFNFKITYAILKKLTTGIYLGVYLIGCKRA